MIRINSGKYRGRKLKVYEREDLRPLPSRGRESLINRIQDKIADASVLELFAGSGIFAIECLSRGAKDAIFVDADRKVISLLKENIASINLTEDVKFVANDVFKLNSGRLGKKDIIFADPPFGKNMIEKLLQWIKENDLLNDDGILALKHEYPMDLPELENFRGPDTRKFASVGITLYYKNETSE